MEGRLRREDLYVGRRVAYDELRDILDTYIVLKDTEGFIPNLYGTIEYITNERNKHMTGLVTSGECRCIFNDSMDLDEDISYDE